MRRWKMKAADFYDLLINEQDFRCYLSGKVLSPKTARIVRKDPEEPDSRKNVCLVHEIVARLTHKWSIAQIREICSAIARYTKDKITDEPFQPKIRSKSKWHLALDRIANFNQKEKNHSKSIKKTVWTWGERASEQLRQRNRSHVIRD